MKFALIGVLTLVVIAVGYVVAAGPEPHIVIPGDVLTSIGPLEITSTLLGAWLTMILLIIVAFAATRSMTLIPTGMQNFIEGIIEFLLNQVEQIAGRENGRRFFTVVATFFLFILVGNWLGLLPFYKNIGITEDYGYKIFKDIQEDHAAGGVVVDDYHYFAWEMAETGGVGIAPIGGDTFKFDTHEGENTSEVLDRYIVALAVFFTGFERPEGVADDAVPTAAEVGEAFAALEADPDAPKFLAAADGDGVPSAGLGTSFTRVDFPGDKVAMVYPFFRASFSDINNTLGLAIVAFLIIEFWGFKYLGFAYLGKFFVNPLRDPVMSFVGILELVSEFIRIISFSFRLFGNIFAGGVLLLIMTFLVPFIAPIGIYGLELFVGLIQAIVFSLLVLVFGVGAVSHHGDHDEEHGHGHGDDGHGGHEPGVDDANHQPGALQAH